MAEGLNNAAGLTGGVLFPSPPAYPSSSRHQLLYVNTSYTCVDIINAIMGECRSFSIERTVSVCVNSSEKRFPEIGNNETHETAGNDAKVTNVVGGSGVGGGGANDVEVEDDVMDEYCDKITLAAGVTAKDKRLKDSTPTSGSSRGDESAKKSKKMAGGKGECGGDDSCARERYEIVTVRLCRCVVDDDEGTRRLRDAEANVVGADGGEIRERVPISDDIANAAAVGGQRRSVGDADN